MSEASLQRYFKREAKKAKIFWRKIKFEGVRGCPDIFVANKGQIKLVELKNPTGTGVLSKLQVRTLSKLREAGVEVHIVHTKASVDALIRDLSGT